MSPSGEHRLAAEALELADTLPPEPPPDTERDPSLWRMIDEAERFERD